MAKKQKRRDLSAQSPAFNQSLGDLLSAAGIHKKQENETDTISPATQSPATEIVEPQWRLLAGAHLAVDKKGRKGKTVTVVSGVALEDEQKQVMARDLGRRLGCRCFIEEGQLVLQGDQRVRLHDFLLSTGVLLS